MDIVTLLEQNKQLKQENDALKSENIDLKTKLKNSEKENNRLQGILKNLYLQG